MEFSLDQSPVIPEPQQVVPAKKPKKIGLIIGLVLALVAVAVAAYFIYGALTNTYKTPVKVMEKIANSDSVDFEKIMLQVYNGFAEDEYKEMFRLMKKSDSYEKLIENLEESLEAQLENNEEKYGKNYKVKMKITEKEKLDKDALEEYEDNLRSQGKRQLDSMEEVDDYDDSDWESMSDAIGMSVSDCKKYAKATEALAKKFKSAKVTAGYELTVTQITTGSELDEPEEEEKTLVVYKVDGRWVAGDSLSISPF